MDKCTYVSFGGAGVHGFAYLGSLQKYFPRADKFSAWRDALQGIGGVSSGTIIALALVLRMSLDEIKDFVERFPLTDILFKDSTGTVNDFMTGHGKGFLSGLSLSFIAQTLLIERQIDPAISLRGLHDLGFPDFRVLVVDLATQTPRVLSFATEPDMPVHLAMRASMTVPVLFHAVQWKGQILVDGACEEYRGAGLFADVPFIETKYVAFSVEYWITTPPTTDLLYVVLSLSRYMMRKTVPNAKYWIKIDTSEYSHPLNLFSFDPDALIEAGHNASL